MERIFSPWPLSSKAVLFLGSWGRSGEGKQFFSFFGGLNCQHLWQVFLHAHFLSADCIYKYLGNSDKIKSSSQHCYIFTNGLLHLYSLYQRCRHHRGRQPCSRRHHLVGALVLHDKHQAITKPIMRKTQCTTRFCSHTSPRQS